MYYNRTLTQPFSQLFEQGGAFRWLFDYVKDSEDLDFQIGKSKSREWVSVYRGTSRVLKIQPYKGFNVFNIDADRAYRLLATQGRIDIYGRKEPDDFGDGELGDLLGLVRQEKKLDRYYNNRKEGYYQNLFSRTYGIGGEPDGEFVIIDKEAVIGYENEEEKTKEYRQFRNPYSDLLGTISGINPERYGGNRGKKAIGNELDFLALDKNGDLLLIEFKHGTSTSGIYLSPLQIGLYYDLFSDLHQRIGGLEEAVFSMLEQKQRIGLVNPSWQKPSRIRGLIPVLIIAQFNERSVARAKFAEIMRIIRKETNNQDFLKGIRIHNYTSDAGLTALHWKIE